MYKVVRDDLARRIREGRYEIGQRLPGRNTLMREYGVAYGTIDRALRRLRAERVIEVRNGLGSFVARVPGDFQEARRTGEARAPRVTASEAEPDRKTPRLTGRASLAVIGSCHRYVPHNWSQVLVGEIERGFTNAGGSTRVYNRFPEPSPTPIPLEEVLDSALADGADAIVVAGLHYPGESVEAVARWRGLNGPPVAFITWAAFPSPIIQVYHDNVDGGAIAADHCLRAGYRRLGFVTLFETDWERERLEGVRRATARAKQGTCELLELSVEPGDRPDAVPHLSATWGNRTARRLARRSLEVWLDALGRDGRGAIICPTDLSALGVLDVMEHMGIRPGAELGLLGFDNRPQSQGRGLTTIRPPLETLAATAVRRLVDSLEGRQGPLRICCEPQLIARGSTIRTAGRAGSEGI
jgi:DNA-binding LacI/PurR family transcriptional regulator